MSHLTAGQLSALADGALEAGARAPAERHLETCAACREALAGLVAQDRALHSVLEHDPGEAYFASFAGRVGGRLRAAGLDGAQARSPGGRGLAEWFRAPRKLALVASLATVVAGAGIVMLATREVRVPALREKELESRGSQEAPYAPPAPLPGAAPKARSADAGARSPVRAPAVVPPGGGAGAPVAARLEEPELRGAGPPGQPGVAYQEESAAPARDARAPSSRAYPARRNAAGEDVPVARPGAAPERASRVVAAPPPAVAGAPVYVRKQRAAEPLESRERTDALREGSASAPAGVASRQVAESGAAVTADKGALEDEARAAPAPVVEERVTAGKEAAATLHFRGGRSALGGLELAGPRDAYDSLPTQPRTLAKNAQRLTTLAELIDVAPAWDSAAAEWERVIEGVQGGPLERATRFQLAHARFAAWRRAASEKRRGRAVQALEAFLAVAPRGAERDSAQAWMRSLER